MIRNVGAKRHCQPNLRSGRTEPMPQSFVKVDRKQHFKETCFNHVHRTSFFRKLEKLKRKQVNSTARSADMAERRAAKHCCLRCHLWGVSFKGKSVFNRLLGNSWSNFDDFNPHFNYNQMLKKSKPEYICRHLRVKKNALRA